MVVVIAPSASSEIYQGLKELAAVEPPIWAGLIHNALHKSNIPAVLIDQEGEKKTDEQILGDIRALQPTLIVIVVYGHQPSASTQTMHAAARLSELLLQSGISQILVGGYPSALPRLSLEQTKATYVAKGEGINVIEALYRGEDPFGIPGLYHKSNGKIFEPATKDKVSLNLDETYPGIQWDKLPMKNYRAHTWHVLHQPHTINSYAAIYTSLGCPFKCSFCCINAPFDSHSFRYWSPTFTVDQIELLSKNYGIQNLKIADEMFVLKEAHFLDICNQIIDRKININMWAYARVDTVKPKYLETLKKSGVNWLALGIESGSQYVRDGVTKGRFNMDDIYRIVKDIQSHGIYVIGNYIFGLPDDTEESMKDTLQLSKELNCEFANFYSAMAYPGSALYTMTKTEDLPSTYLGYSQHAFESKPLRTKTLTASEVLKFRDEAHISYFNSESYLKMVDEKFGQPGLKMIQDMNQKKIQRKIY